MLPVKTLNKEDLKSFVCKAVMSDKITTFKTMDAL